MNRDSFINKYIADDVKSNKRLNNKALRCVYPCCNETAIQSHTISKEDALRSIASNGKVLTFKSLIKDRARTLEATLLGINEATIFRGFCKKHDDLFVRLDNGLFENEYDLVLQLLRCVGWWKSIESEKSQLINEHKSALLEYENENREEIGIPKQAECSISYDSGLSETDEMYTELVKAVENEKDNLEREVLSGKNVFKLGKWTILYAHLGYKIPLAMSSRHPFKICEDMFSIHWTVIPHNDSTDIILFLDANGINGHVGINAVESNWAYRVSSNLTILETVEAAMVSSECWYMSPDVYESLSDTKKENLKFDVRYKCMSSPVWETVDYTIFDTLWLELIQDEHNPDIVKVAKEKLAFIPKRLTQEDWDKEEAKLARRIFEIYHH